MADDLMPPNASVESKALAATTKRITDIPVPIDTLWDPWRCPIELLPGLAWALSVDHWNPAWPEETKRAVVASSYDVHAYKGTPHAMFAALNGMLLDGELIEWHERVPEGEPGTFELIIFADRSEALLSAETQADAIAAVEAVKRRSQHADVRMGMASTGAIGLAAGIDAGATLDLEGTAATRDRLASQITATGALAAGSVLDLGGTTTGRDALSSGLTIAAALGASQIMEFG